MLRNIIIGLFSTCAISANANTSAQPKHIVVAPNCLIQDIHHYKKLTAINNLSLIETNDAGIDELITAKDKQTTPCGGFMDVTAHWNTFKPNNLSAETKAKSFLSEYATPAKQKYKANEYSIRYQTEVKTLLKQMNPQFLWTRLETLSNSYPDRYSRSENGVNVAHEIKAEIEALAKKYNRNDVSVYLVSTGSYIQPSVVAKLGSSEEPGVVIGAHMDTLAANVLGNKPGADDDGSGSVTVLEVAHTLLASEMHFKKPIYLIWYAAEEVGLIGSQYVVADFKKKNIPVAAVMQMDMTGYAYQNDPTMWLMDDYVNKDLTAFLETLINTYVKQPVKHSACGYACSDHATWYKNGFASAIPFESSMNTDNPYIHTSKDTIEKLSLSHMTDYASLAIAFAVELAEPVAG